MNAIDPTATANPPANMASSTGYMAGLAVKFRKKPDKAATMPIDPTVLQKSIFTTSFVYSPLHIGYVKKKIMTVLSPHFSAFNISIQFFILSNFSKSSSSSAGFLPPLMVTFASFMPVFFSFSLAT